MAGCIVPPSPISGKVKNSAKTATRAQRTRPDHEPEPFTQLLADTLSAHDPAAFGVHVPAGLGGGGVRVAGSGVLARVGSGLAEERGEEVPLH